MGDFKMMPTGAHALVPYRFTGDGDAVEYEGMTFPRDPQKGCDLIWRRIRATGGETEDKDAAYGMIDVVSEDDDLLGTFLIADRRSWLYAMNQIGRPRRIAPTSAGTPEGDERG